MVEIAFTKVKLPYGWLGNMSPHPVSYDGIDYPTAEALFQSLRFNSIESRHRIAAVRSPMTAKMLAKKHRSEMNIVPMSGIDVENMRLVIRTKIEQHQKYDDAKLQGKVPTDAETNIHIGTDPSVLDPTRHFLKEKVPEYEIELGLIPDARDFRKS